MHKDIARHRLCVVCVGVDKTHRWKNLKEPWNKSGKCGKDKDVVLKSEVMVQMKNTLEKRKSMPLIRSAQEREV